MRFGLILLLLSGLVSCKPETNEKPVVYDSGVSKVLVLCEGNFTWGNATVDEYLPLMRKLNSNVYSKANDNLPLGDVLQSGLVEKNDLWLVVNNSGKVERLEPNTYKRKGTATGLQSPRFLVRTNDSILWCSDLYSGYISVINTHTMQVQQKIAASGRTEEMLLVNDAVWVTAFNKGVEIRSKMDGKLLNTVALKTGAQWIVPGKGQNVWVLCSDSGRSVLYSINSTSEKVEKTFEFPAGKFATRLCHSKSGDSLYWIAEGLFAMAENATELPVKSVFQPAGSNFYGLDVDHNTGEIYVGDAGDYVSKGQVYVLSPDFVQLTRFATGIIPGAFLFYK